MLKQILKGIILSTALFFISISTVNAASAYVGVSSSSSRVVVGNTFTVTVNISSGVALGSWEFSLDYSSNIVKLTSGTASIVDYGNGSKTSQSYTYTFKAIASGSAYIGVKSYGAYAWDETKLGTSAGSTTVKTITQAELAASYSKDNYLKSLSVSSGTISPEFNKETTDYTVKLDSSIEKITIGAEVNDNTASLSGIGEFEVSEGENKFEIIVTAENGSKKTYTLTAIVEDPNPITVQTTDNKTLTIVKRAKSLIKPNTFTEKNITISEIEIPAFYSEITDLTLVGLKDSNGNVYLYIYNENKNTYTLYREITFSSLIIYPKELIENKNFENYIKTKITINDEEVEVYKIKDTSSYSIFYGVNIETNDEGFYLYDSVNNSIVKYNSETEDELNEKLLNYKKIIVILIGESLILFMLVISISISNSRKKRKIKIYIEKKQEQKIEQPKLEIKSEKKTDVNKEKINKSPVEEKVINEVNDINQKKNKKKKLNDKLNEL